MPCGGASDETATTGVSRSPTERSARAQVAARAQRDLAEVRLGDHEHVGDLHDPALEELQRVAGCGLHHDRDGVRDLRHVGLALADADRLDDDDVERGGERRGGLARRGREPSEPPRGGGRADEDGVVGGIERDPRAVAEQRAAAAPRGRVDREHGDAEVRRAPLPHELREQRGLAGTGRAGDADDVALSPRRRARRGRGGAAAPRSAAARRACGSRRGSGPPARRTGRRCCRRSASAVPSGRDIGQAR